MVSRRAAAAAAQWHPNKMAAAAAAAALVLFVSSAGGAPSAAEANLQEEVNFAMELYWSFNVTSKLLPLCFVSSVLLFFPKKVSDVTGTLLPLTCSMFIIMSF